MKETPTDARPYSSPAPYLTYKGWASHLSASRDDLDVGQQSFDLCAFLRKLRTMYQLEVAVPAPLPQTFTYTAEQEIVPGTRVVVPFGKQKLIGVALGPAVSVDPKFALKAISRVVDEGGPAYSSVTLELARWLANYYLHPLGEVLRAMLPASVTKTIKESCYLSDRGRDLIHLNPGSERAQLLVELFATKGSITRETIKRRLKQVKTAEPVSLNTLIDEGWITLSRTTEKQVRGKSKNKRPTRTSNLDAEKPEPAALPTLTTRQTEVVDAIVRDGLAATNSRVFLLRGVTGSGKTEVYLRLIAEVLNTTDADKQGQALVLVPEISLTPQMTRVFEQRFPGIVAVVHSAMSDADRWAQLDRIRRQDASILIGPRSAVFGPFAKLRLLIVDEEHDGSYKQSTGLTYNGRDVAVLRGRLEKATVVLGSATPSMESLYNALSNRYQLLEMPERVSGRALPAIELVDVQQEKQRGSLVTSPSKSSRTPPNSTTLSSADDMDAVPIDARVLQALEQNLQAGHQAIVLVNRRGYAYYLFSLEEKKAVQCPQCSISYTLHKNSTILRCHYCDHQTTVAKIIEARPTETFLAVGYGSQKAEDFLKQKIPQARIVRLDSDTVTKRDYLPQTLAQFRRGEIDILVGTQILAKGHDFPNVTLIAILEVDQLLGLPDFRAGERTFQLIVQAAGRAGRAELPGKVMIQAMRSSHPVVQAALSQDFNAFAQRELGFRKAQGYPPFARMIAFEFNAPDKVRLVELSQRIDAWVEHLAGLKPELLKQVKILGPAIPPIETIRGRHRRQVILSAESVEPLRQLANYFITSFGKPQGDMRLRIDVDPQSLI